MIRGPCAHCGGAASVKREGVLLCWPCALVEMGEMEIRPSDPDVQVIDLTKPAPGRWLTTTELRTALDEAALVATQEAERRFARLPWWERLWWPLGFWTWLRVRLHLWP